MNRKRPRGNNGAEAVSSLTQEGKLIKAPIDLRTKKFCSEASARNVALNNEPNRSCVDKIFARGSEYSGGWIKAAWDFLEANELLDATRAFEKARNGFGRGKPDWKCLEEWRAYVRVRALQKARVFVRVMLSDSFYKELNIPALPIPLCIEESGETVVLRNEWSIVELLTNLRYYVLANENECKLYSPILSRLAREAAVEEGLSGNRDRAEFYFTLAKDVSRHYVSITIHVANGYVQIGDRKKALEEFEKAREFMRRRNDFIPAVWLATATLQCELGHNMRTKNTMQDYFARVKNRRKARSDAQKWFKDNNAPSQILALLG